MLAILFGLFAISAPAQGQPAAVATPIPHYVRMTGNIAPIPGHAAPGSRSLSRIPVHPSPFSHIDSFPAPDSSPFGLEWIGGMLWSCDLFGHEIREIDPGSDSVVRSFGAPDQWSKDLAFDGTDLFVCGNYESRIYRVDTATGGTVGSFGAPGSNPVGLCFDGTYLWNADWNSDQSQPNYIYKLDPANGQVLSRILTPAKQPAGLAWDGTGLWNADMSSRTVYRLDPNTGAVLRAVGTPGATPTGLAWDAAALWNSDWTLRRFYRYAPDSALPVLTINSPGDFDVLPCWRNAIVTGTIWGPDLQHYTVEYGTGENPVSWVAIGGQHTNPAYLDTLVSWDVSGITQADVYWLRVNAVFADHTDTLQRVKIALDPQIAEGWPQTLVNVSPVGVADADGAGEEEIFAGLNHQDYLNQKLGGWQLDGSLFDGFPVAGINNCQMAPAFLRVPGSSGLGIVTGYDLNNDAVNAVNYDGTNLPGWPRTGGRPGTNQFLGLPAIADINHDTIPEIFTGGANLSGWRLDGNAITGFPVTGQFSSPAIGDLNRDGNPELVCLSGSALWVLDSNGAAVPGFPKTYSGASLEQYPVLGDINSDQHLEAVFGLGTKLYAVNFTGARRPRPRRSPGNHRGQRHVSLIHDNLGLS